MNSMQSFDKLHQWGGPVRGIIPVVIFMNDPCAGNALQPAIQKVFRNLSGAGRQCLCNFASAEVVIKCCRKGVRICLAGHPSLKIIRHNRRKSEAAGGNRIG